MPTAFSSSAIAAAHRFEFLAHLGQLGERGQLELLFAFGRGGDAQHHGPVRHVVGDAGHRAEDRPVPMCT